MKRQKPDNAPAEKRPKPSIEKLRNYIDDEVTLIHQDLEELKHFLGAHQTMGQEHELDTDTRAVDGYYDSANDLFRQIALECDTAPPIEAKFYETLILRKKKKQPPSKRHSSPHQDGKSV